MRTFDDYTAALVARARATEGVVGLVLLGSASTAAAGRRDEWSDHDLYVATTDPAADRLRRDAPFLPDPERIVALAHEGGLGVSVLYDDLHLMEMAVGTVAQIGSLPMSGDHEVVMGPGPGTRSAPPAVDARDEAILTLVKLLVGTGRVRRGERLNGSAFVRVYALGHLIAAVRARVPTTATAQSDELDGWRRFERGYPEIGQRLGRLVDAPLDEAAEGTYRALRDILEPGWPDFPTTAADLVAARLGWPLKGP